MSNRVIFICSTGTDTEACTHEGCGKPLCGRGFYVSQSINGRECMYALDVCADHADAAAEMLADRNEARAEDAGLDRREGGFITLRSVRDLALVALTVLCGWAFGCALALIGGAR